VIGAAAETALNLVDVPTKRASRAWWLWTGALLFIAIVGGLVYFWLGP
jgi:hypothetical protein